MELEVFPKIKAHKGFTGCLHLIEASASPYSRKENKEQRKISGPTSESNVGICNGRSKCQETSMEKCGDLQTCQEIGKERICQDVDITDRNMQMEARFNGYR